MTTDQIIAATTCHDPERFRYEVESKTRYNGDFEYGYGYYPKGLFRYAYSPDSVILFNLLKKPVAIFRVKAWK